jgi:PAS domain S-box-containing protein
MTRTDQNDLAGHHRLHAFLKRWFRTPGPWPSELLQRRAEVLHAAHLFVLFMSAVYLVVPRSVLNGQTIFVLATILVAAVGSGFLRRGWIHLSGIWTIGVMWLIFTLGSVTEGGLSSSSFGGSIAIILFAGLAFGLRMVIATAVMTIAAGVGIVYLQHASLLPHPAVTYSDLNVLSDFTVYFAITALFTGIAVRRIDTSTQRSEEEIAARKRSEDSLRDREAYMRSLIENINDIITVIDGTGKILYVSSSVERLLGYDPQTRLGENILHSIHPEDVPIARGLLTRGLAGTSPSSGVLLRYLHVDGTWRTLEISIKVTRNSDGSAMGVLTSRDVTERRRAEEQLEMNERRFRAIVEHSSEAFVLIRADGTVDYAGPTVARLTGYPSGEREGQQVFELVYADDRDAVRKQFADLVKRPGGVISMVFRSVRKDGTVWWMEATGTNMLHAPGVGAIVLNYRDVTERKKAEEALSESEERFRSLYENSTVGIYRTTPDGRVLLANPSLVQMLGHSSFEELAARNLEQGEFEAGYARSSFIMQVERDGEVRGLESRWTTRSGGNIYVRESARAVRDASGRTLFYDGIVEDISERKRAEERIEQLALQQENILETITAGIVHLKLGRATWANSAFAAMFGLQDVAIADVDAGSLFADKGAYEQIRTQVSARYGTAVHLASEMEMLRRDGTHFWCAVVGRSIDPESLAAGSIWMFQDITDRRNA